MKKYFRLLAIVMLMMIVKPAYSAAVELDLPEKGKIITESQMYYNLIPTEKRDTFIKQFLAEGLRQSGKNIYRSTRDTFELENIQLLYGRPPTNFATNLLNWTKVEFDVSDEFIETVVTSSKKVCLPAKGCYPDGPGQNCCPF